MRNFWSKSLFTINFKNSDPSIYTGTHGGVSVEFKCTYDSKVDLQTDLTIETPIDVSGDVTVSDGLFDAGLELAFWDPTWTTKITTGNFIQNLSI